MSTPNGDARGAYAAAVELRPDVPLPDVTPVRRRPADEPRVDDVPAATRAALAAAPGVGDRDLTGLRIAVTAGSRGIADVATVVIAAVAWLREAGAEPFVVPAMGSHGGARAEGQVEVLADLGVTEAALGAPIEATMETVVLGHLPDGTPIHHDAVAAAADGVLLVNRVKPHTDFRGYAESGLAKIAAIGLGNHRGASTLHAGGTAHLGEAVLAAIEVIRGHGHLLGGLGIVENSAEETAEVTFVSPDGLGAAEERALLDRAAAYLPVLPFEQLDVLVVDRMGKDLSGSGMDTNVLGRCWVPGVEEFAPPHVTAITVHGLTPASHGNAVGFGLADVAPVSMLDGIDFRATYLNGITSGTGGLRRSRSPMLLADDDAVVRAAVSMCGRRDKAAVRLGRIPDTLHPGTLLVSGALLDEVAADADLEVLGDPRPLTDGTHLTAW